MEHVKTTIRSLTTWAQIHDLTFRPINPPLQPRLKSLTNTRSQQSVNSSADHHHLTVSQAQALKLSADKLLLFEWLQAYEIRSCVYESHYYWPGTQESSQLLQTGKSLLTFLTMVTRWSRSMFNFYVLIGQKLTGEFMRKIYAASWNLFTGSWNWQSFV